jgi:hypothetical protein
MIPGYLSPYVISREEKDFNRKVADVLKDISYNV